MNTLLRRFPSTHPPSLSLHPSSSSISFHLLLTPKTLFPTSSTTMLFPLSFQTRPSFFTPIPTSSSSFIRRCATHNQRQRQRPCLSLKEQLRVGVGGSTLGWFHTCAGGPDYDGMDGASKTGGGVVKVQRRVTTGGGTSTSTSSSSSSSSSGVDNADVAADVDNDDGSKVGGGGVVKTARRVRGGGASNGGGGLSGSPDLLTIPGVGPRNFQKLVQNGIAALAELKQLYKDKFSKDSSQKMVEYLQSSVGIIHRNHAESITSYIKKSVDEELKEDSSSNAASQKKRITFCVEGNISVGKTTFLKRIANETLELRDLVEVVPEPIDKWQNVGPDHFNILDAFYAEPERYAYTFQNYVFVTRVMQERDSSGGIQPLRLMERSVFSDRMVFVRAVHEAKWMNEMEISIYDSWFDPVVSCLPGLIPDGFIYLRASPDTCHKRMQLRKREEEGGVSLDYLRGLHEKHESWLLPFESGNHGVLSVCKFPLELDSALHPEIRDRVYFLEGPHMHSCIQKIPALVLDCDRDIDFNRDIEAKSHYARQVAEFFEFVKKEKAAQSAKAGEEGPKIGQPHPQILLPQKGGGLCFPNGHPFPSSDLKTLDFRRAMSFLSS